MEIWFQIGIALNVVYWGVFFYLLSRRRWNVPALAVGLFHMLFAAVSSVAPIRSLLDPNYAGYEVGVIHFEGRAVALPAALVLGWALAAAWIAVGKRGGGWMRLITAGDLFLALGLGVSVVLDGPSAWSFQLGEHFAVTGVAGLFVVLSLFTLPFVASAIWAMRRAKRGGGATPLASDARGRRDDSGSGGGDINSFRYSESLP
jgi:hypothetical protein